MRQLTGKEKNNRTNMRVDRGVRKELQNIKLKDETDAELLARLLKIFGKRGVPREITQKVMELGEITSKYISSSTYEVLDIFRTWLLLLTKMGSEAERIVEVEGMAKILERYVASRQKQMEDFKN